MCPAEFDVGAIKNLILLSLPEGDDKPLKYPLMFEVSNIVCITKIDTLNYFDFSLDKVKKNIKLRNKTADIFTVSAKNNIGMDEVSKYLEDKINQIIR